MLDRHRQLATLARQQHGLFLRDQARSLGWTDTALRDLVRSGWCDLPRRGVLRMVGAPVTNHQLDLAAVWFSGDEALTSHRAAARIWEMRSFATAGPEVSKPRGQSQRREYGLVHGSLLLPPHHRTERFGIPVTTPGRTIFDLAGVVHPGRTERALDEVLARRLCTLAEIQNVFFLLARRGRRGTATMRMLLDARGEGYVAPASELERVARRLFAARGLPTPDFEVDLGSTEDWVGRVDCCWRQERVIVELDGRQHHSTLRDRTADRRRDNALMAAGWRVLRVTWDDLHQRPDEVVAWIRSALASAAA